MKEDEFIECMVNSYNDKGEIIKVVEELREQNELLVEQLQNTRKWIRKYQKVFDEIAHQAAYVSCSALNIEEWIEEGD